ncbi:MAG: hypothetical protein BGO09_09425 [Bacteroidetes bacterium 47-18]|nr:MAG: hypothetical protein BGO09_09425 [Bacteroidetes bacterium 47-18]
MHTEAEHELLKEQAGKKTLKIGLVFAGLILLAHVLIHVTNSHSNYQVLVIPELLLITAVIISTIVYRRSLRGYAAFGELFSNGFKTTALLTIFLVLWILLSLQIFPEIKEIDIRLAKESMTAAGYNEEQLNESLASYQDNKIYYLGKIFNMLRLDFLLGILTTVILAMFLRSRNS